MIRLLLGATVGENVSVVVVDSLEGQRGRPKLGRCCVRVVGKGNKFTGLRFWHPATEVRAAFAILAILAR